MRSHRHLFCSENVWQMRVIKDANCAEKVVGDSFNMISVVSDLACYICRDRMVRLFKLIALLGVVVLCSGCAGLAALPVSSVLGSPNSTALEIHNNTDVRLQQPNFIVTKANASGQNMGFSLFGILTIVPAKFSTAMSRLYAQAALQPGRSQTVANLILERNSTFYILFSVPQIAVSADVIEFIPGTAPSRHPRCKEQQEQP